MGAASRALAHTFSVVALAATRGAAGAASGFSIGAMTVGWAGVFGKLGIISTTFDAAAAGFSSTGRGAGAGFGDWCRSNGTTTGVGRGRAGCRFDRRRPLGHRASVRAV